MIKEKKNYTFRLYTHRPRLFLITDQENVQHRLRGSARAVERQPLRLAAQLRADTEAARRAPGLRVPR